MIYYLIVENLKLQNITESNFSKIEAEFCYISLLCSFCNQLDETEFHLQSGPKKAPYFVFHLIFSQTTYYENFFAK